MPEPRRAGRPRRQRAHRHAGRQHWLRLGGGPGRVRWPGRGRRHPARHGGPGGPCDGALASPPRPRRDAVADRCPPAPGPGRPGRRSAGPHRPGPGRGRGGHLRGAPPPAGPGRRERLAAGPRLVLRRARRAAGRQPPRRGGPGTPGGPLGPRPPLALAEQRGRSRWPASQASRTHPRAASSATQHGAPTGIMFEHAAGLVDGVIPVPTAAAVEAAITAYARDLARLGVTSVHDPGGVAPDPELRSGPTLYRALAGGRSAAAPRHGLHPRGAARARHRGRLPDRPQRGGAGLRPLPRWLAEALLRRRAGQPHGRPPGALRAGRPGRPSTGRPDRHAAARRSAAGRPGPPGCRGRHRQPDPRHRGRRRADGAGCPGRAAHGGRRMAPRGARAARASVGPWRRFAALGVAASVQPCHLLSDAPAIVAAWGCTVRGGLPAGGPRPRRHAAAIRHRCAGGAGRSLAWHRRRGDPARGRLAVRASPPPRAGHQPGAGAAGCLPRWSSFGTPRRPGPPGRRCQGRLPGAAGCGLRGRR